MSEHTPGPWNTQSDPCHYDTISTVVAGERMIVHVGGCCEPAEQEANARLIAAAPELLEALEYALGELECLKKAPDSDYARPDDDCIKQAKLAIAKAKGEV